MTRINVELAGALLSSLAAWADLVPDVQKVYPEWDPKPETYEADLERFVRAQAQRKSALYHPEGLAMIKAAMRWVLAEAPDYAQEWYDYSLCELDHPPEPMVKLWQWAWDAVFDGEPWDIPGETFELYIDFNEIVTKKGWGENLREPDPRPYTWPRPE